MGGVFKAPHVFNITPHKVSLSVLIQIYATPIEPVQPPVPLPFSTIRHHNSFGLFLFAQTKACDDILEPNLEELIAQLEDLSTLPSHWLTDHLVHTLSSFSTPDDLFNLFSGLRGILGRPGFGAEYDPIILDANSTLGVFLRRCILAFNLLSFEGVCQLLSNVQIYCKVIVSRCVHYSPSHIRISHNDLEVLSDDETMDENVLDKFLEDVELKNGFAGLSFHFHVPKAFSSLIGDIEFFGQKVKCSNNTVEACFDMLFHGSKMDTDDPSPLFLRTNWQVQGFLMQQAEKFAKHDSCLPINYLESILRRLQRIAPELHRVHFLRFMANLAYDDYSLALENLIRYFDCCAGREGFDFDPDLSGRYELGRHEVAFLYMGMMHFHFGHPRLAIEALTEAVLASQQHNDDACLAYTLTAICNLLSEIGISRTTGILRSQNSPVSSIGISLSVQQQLFVLLGRSLGIAESLKLKRLTASNHLAMAKFDLTHVQRPLLSFGPKASLKPRTCPVRVCRELRLGFRLSNEYDGEGYIMPIDGALCTTWIKSLKKPLASLIFGKDYDNGKNAGAFFLFTPPSSFPCSVMQTIGSTYLIRATAWEMYGSEPLARINALVYLTCFSNDSSSGDLALSYAKLIQHLAIFNGYKESFTALYLAEEKFSSVYKSPIHVLKLAMMHQRAIHRGDLKVAHRLCNELGALASPVSGVDVDLKTEANLRRAKTLLASKQFREAAVVAQELFSTCYKFNMQIQNATILLLLAEINMKSGNAVMGLPYALASLSFCQSYNLDLMKATCVLTLGELWLSLGSNHAKMALALVHASFPIILGHGGLELRARAHLAEAKCYLSDTDFSGIASSETVLHPLRSASQELEALEYHELAAEAFYLLAIVHDKVGDFEEREIAASSFRRHILALEHPTDGSEDGYGYPSIHQL